MAQDRFYFWSNYYDALKLLSSDEERGRFVMAMCSYAFEGIEPRFDDSLVLRVAWAMVADHIRESVEIGRRSSANGKRGGRPKKDSKRGALSTPESTEESTPESAMHGNASSGCAPSLDAQALAAGAGDPRWANVTVDEDEARRAALEFIESFETGGG